MKILVTGGTGSVGTPLVARLVRNGHDVTVIGRSPDVDISGADYQICSVQDHESLMRVLPDHEAIIHLAAIPNPGRGSEAQIFDVNCAGTFNLFDAAAACGIRRVVVASSINAFGYFYGVRGFPIPYFPIDEDCPSHTSDAYSFSKQITEEIGAYFWRRYGISSASLRIPWVYPQSSRAFILKSARYWQEWAERPEKERLESATRMVAAAQRYREARNRHDREQAQSERSREEGRGAINYLNFWANCSGEDSAQAFEKAATADYDGAHTLFINDKLNAAEVETEKLLRAFFPEVTRRTRPIPGAGSAISVDRAHDLIGFDPQDSLHTWAETVEAESA